MSAPISVWKGNVIPGLPWCITCWICDGLSAHDLARTQPEAFAAGLAHLREVHDEAEAAAKYARDTTPDWEYLRSLAHKAPRVRRQVSNYCRAHGCHRGECGCGHGVSPDRAQNAVEARTERSGGPYAFPPVFSPNPLSTYHRLPKGTNA